MSFLNRMVATVAAGLSAIDSIVQSAAEGVLFFRKRDLEIAVVINSDGGSFSLMGS